MLLICAGFVLSFNLAAVSALIPSVAKTFQIDIFFAGRMEWLYLLPYGLSALFYGPLARSLDSKKILIFCLSIFSFANFLAAGAANIYCLFTARFFAGVAGAAITPLSLILIAQTTVAQERGKKIGSFFSLTFVSSLLGLFFSGLLFWRWIFFIPAVTAALVCLGIYFYFPKFLPENKNLQFNYLQTFSELQIRRLFIYIFSISFLYHGIRQWLGVYFSCVYGLGQFLISMLLTTISFSGIFGEFLGGIFADKFGRLKIANLGAGLMFFALAMLLFKNILVGLFVIMAIWGLGWTLNHAGLSTNLSDLSQKYLYESASLNSAVRFLSGGLGMLFGGVLARWDFNLQFVIFAFCLFLLLCLSKKLVL